MNISEMTLEQKIGQMLIVGFPSLTYDENIQKAIEEYSIGNVILFARNIKDTTQLAKLNETIQNKCIEHNKIPAFITIDQEGGMVVRIKEGATFLPGNMTIAAANGDTNMSGQIAGKELRALGINMNLAPCLDINNNPDNPVIGVRSYSEDKKTVAKLGVNYIKGLQSQGVLATAKHFPGHGDTSVDSHLALPCIKHSVDRIKEVELYPFKEAIDNGVEAIMTAHVLFPTLEPEKLPSTMSYEIVTKLLKNKLGFKGLVISDCMEMNAVKDYYGTANAVIKAINAGVDMCFVSHTLKLQIDCVKKVKQAVLDGIISEDRIDEAVSKILSVKEKYNLFDNPLPSSKVISNEVGQKQYLDFAQSVNDNSITLVSEELGYVPVDNNGIVSISPQPTGLTMINMESFVQKGLNEIIQDNFGGQSIGMSLDPTDEEIKDIISNISNEVNKIIIGTYNGHLFKGQIKLINELYKLKKDLIIIALRNPYDFSLIKDIKAQKYCSYEYTPNALESIVKLLKGEIKPKGQLPVTI